MRSRTTRIGAVVLPTAALLGLLAHAASGNIHPLAIEIDANANLYAAQGATAFEIADADVAATVVPCGPAVNGPILNPGATADWVADCDPNTDVDPDPTDNVAVGVVVGVTGAAADGHWNGVRLVDGIAGDDQDIFLTGGKENDTSTWNVGPGSVGSSKYDITQAYLANNQSTLFFGMERRGHNGTTAFDFEFNAVGTSGTYIPIRSVGDVLFTFEMQGSGSSGSATPHVFRWNGTAFVELPMPVGLLSSINSSEVPAAPWGYVDSKGNWVLGNLPRFEFAEALVPLSSISLPGVNTCGGSAFVQVRTRSSSTATSDLKDTTKIFEFVFGGPDAQGELDITCDQQFTYAATGSTNSTGGSDNLSFAWTFTVPEGVTLSGAGVTGPDGDGAYHSALESGTVDVGLPDGADSATITAVVTATEDESCSDDSEPLMIDVPRALVASAAKVGADGAALSVSLAGGAPDADALQWQRLAAGTWVDIPGATSGALVYSGFEGDDPTTDAITLFFDGDFYNGQQWVVALRLHAERTITHNDGSTTICPADSPAVLVKKVTAVDP